MKSFTKKALPTAMALALLGGVGAANASVYVQCPGDTDGDAMWASPGEVRPADTKCMHLTAGDGFAVMSDGNPMYTFGFADKTGVPPASVLAEGILAARWPGSMIVLDEGDQFYLSLSNVGTVIRPDLFDPHTVHFHGFPNAATVFDGVPEVSISINMGATLTYFYNIVEPGTFLYHCHVEATEHMEMGMLANLFVRPAQNRLPDGTVLGNHVHSNPDWDAVRDDDDPEVGDKYVYNDGDGTTYYDVDAPLQIAAFDSDFHDASLFVQALPFAYLEGDYPQINGRGYPDTVKADLALGPPTDNTAPVDGNPPGKVTGTPGEVLNNGDPSQDMGSLVTVSAGDTLLLRLSNVNIDRFWTLTAPGLTMKVVGTGARQMRGQTGNNIYRETASVNTGGGEANDILVEIPATATPGTTYFLHATELHQMSNKTQLDGGMITEILVL